MSKTLYYDSNTHQLVIGDCSSNELDPITIEPALSADTFKLSEDGKLQIKINGEYVFVGDKSLVGPPPQLKIEDGCLHVSDGTNWTSLGQIVPDDVVAEFASQVYVRTLPQVYRYPDLNTTEDTIIGAINELAALHDMAGTFSHTYNSVNSSVSYKTLNIELDPGYWYSVTGNITPSNSTGVCLVVVPKNAAYVDPAEWDSLSYGEYNNDIQVVNIGETFELSQDSALYLFFTSLDWLEARIPNHFGDTEGWQIGVDPGTDPFQNFPVDVKVTDFKITRVEANAVTYQRLDVLAEINSLSEKVTQLENELNLANNTTVELTNTIASQSEQIVQLQTELSQATTRINTLEADTAWLKGLNQEEMLQYWGSKTSTEE